MLSPEEGITYYSYEIILNSISDFILIPVHYCLEHYKGSRLLTLIFMPPEILYTLLK